MGGGGSGAARRRVPHPDPGAARILARSAAARPRAYRLPELAADAAAVVEAAGTGPVHVIGHDWGGEVAWMLTAWHTEQVRSLTVVSAPHFGGFLRSMWRSSQVLSSWYIVLFQVPGLAERLFDPRSAGGRRRWVRFMAFFEMPEKQALRDLDFLDDRRGVRSALNWYRAMPIAPWSRILKHSKVSVPTLQVWSDGDAAIGRKGAELAAEYATGPYRFEVLHGVSHWIPEEAPEQLVEAVLPHLAG